MRDLADTSQQDSLPRIVLRIPGPWTSHEQLQASMAKAGDKFLVSAVSEEEDAYLLHQPSGQRFSLSVMERDDEIADLFADTGRASPAEVRALADHQVKVFITGPGGSFDAARMFLSIGAAFVKAGALAIMVDNCGHCHSPRDWLSLAGDKKMGGMYWAFVSVTAAKDEVFSAGMHCLGFRDAELPNPADPQSSGMMMHEFLGYTYQSGATILDGDPIGGPDGPEFILRHVECTRFPKDSPWHNPYGVWRLEDVDQENQD